MVLATALRPTLTDALIPGAPTAARRMARDVALVLAGSLVIAALAQVQVQIGVVPFTGSTLGVMLVGAALGARRGAAAVIAYLLEGLVGLPVFAGFSMGAAAILGPTGGYLLGFIPAAFVTGWLAQRGWDRRFWSACLAMVLGNVLVFAFGVPWLATFTGWEVARIDGFLKFVPFDAGAKVLIAAAVLPAAWALLGKGSRDPR